VELGILAVVLAAGLGALSQVHRMSKASRRQFFVAFAAYLVFAACGVAAVVMLPFRPGSNVVAAAAVVFILDWSMLAMLWAARLAQRSEAPTGWVLKPWSVLDWVLIAIAIGAAGLGSLW